MCQTVHASEDDTQVSFLFKEIFYIIMLVQMMELNA